MPAMLPGQLEKAGIYAKSESDAGPDLWSCQERVISVVQGP
jgi:hypothetical protein